MRDFCSEMAAEVRDPLPNRRRKRPRCGSVWSVRTATLLGAAFAFHHHAGSGWPTAAASALVHTDQWTANQQLGQRALLYQDEESVPSRQHVSHFPETSRVQALLRRNNPRQDDTAIQKGRRVRTIFKGKPKVTDEPTSEPSLRPTTSIPTQLPTLLPTEVPGSISPTIAPPLTGEPTGEPTVAVEDPPTLEPTALVATDSLSPAPSRPRLLTSIPTSRPTTTITTTTAPSAPAPQTATSITQTIHMILVQVDTNQLTDSYAFDWQQLTSNYVRHYWNDVHTQSPILVEQVETVLLSRVRLSENYDQENETLQQQQQRQQQQVQQGRTASTAASANIFASSTTSSSPYPLLLQYNQTIVGYFIYKKRYSRNSSRHHNSSTTKMRNMDWLFRKPFAPTTAATASNATFTITSDYTDQLSSLVQNSQPIILESVQVVSAEVTDEAGNSSTMTAGEDDAREDGADWSGGMSWHQVAWVISIAVLVMVCCLVVLTCHCE